MADEVADVSSSANKARFASLSEDDRKRILVEKDAVNTRRATDSALKTFKAYLKEKGLSQDFESMPKNELNEVLDKFYTEARQENGQLYKKSSLCSIRHGLNRYLSKFDTDIIQGPEFKSSNTTFSAAVKELKRQGLGNITHHPPLERDDLVKLYAYFDLEDNVKLQEKVFVDIVLYFGRRGRENIHELKISYFAATTDAKGCLYIFSTRDELTKNHQDDNDTSEGRMYSIPDDDMCPVKSFVKYKRHLNSKCDRLFQRPSLRKNSIQWYEAAPLGQNKIGQMMPSLSEKAKLSRRYCNHSLRSTSVHLLDSVGKFANRHIMSVTGHKAETSLKNYTGYTGEKIKKSMSDTISVGLRSDCDMNTVTPLPPKRQKLSTRGKVDNLSVDSKSISEKENLFSETSVSDIDIQNVTLSLLTDSQEKALFCEFPEDDFEKIVQDIDFENVSTGNTSVNPQTVQISSVTNAMQTVSNFPYPVLSNCSNVTINFNFAK